jgi:hypothetical protein
MMGSQSQRSSIIEQEDGDEGIMEIAEKTRQKSPLVMKAQMLWISSKLPRW